MKLRPAIPSIAVISLIVNAHTTAAAPDRVTSTVYVGRHFEVRDQDQPVKYIFNGDARIALTTGSLSPNARLQRLRLHPGWNSISLAVTATNLPGQLNRSAGEPAPLVDAVYQWQPVTRDYAKVFAGQTVQAGTVLWLKARAKSVVAVAGTYLEPAAPSLPPGGGYLPSPGLESWAPRIPAGMAAWKYDPRAGAWRATLTGALASASDAPPTAAPGEAIYLQNTEAAQFELPNPSRRFLYFHGDHLGSSAIVTDAEGAVVRESAYYPFGALRHDTQTPTTETRYGFAQKESDPESGLADFGRRYLHPTLGRWLNPDPQRERGGGSNPYAYVNQNPLKFEDPDGAEIKVTRKIDPKSRTVSYHIHLKAAFIDVQDTKYRQEQLTKFSQDLKRQIEKSFTGSTADKQRIGKKVERWNFTWKTTADIRLIDKWSEVKKDEHVFRIVESLPGARGETKDGTMLISLRRDIFNSPKGTRTAEETGAHEFGHSAGLGHDDRSPNLMMQGNKRPTDVANIGLYQIQSIYQAFTDGRLNHRGPDMEMLDAFARRKP